MALTGQVPILKCHSVERSLTFYKDTLGFVEIKSRRANDRLEWVYINSGKTFLMLELKNETETKLEAGIRLYFYTDDIDNLYQYMSAKQYAVSQIETTAYLLKQFSITDPDGYKIQIGETIRK